MLDYKVYGSKSKQIWKDVSLTFQIQLFPIQKEKKNQHVFTVFTQIGVKQLIDFLRTATAASDLVDCTLVHCRL